MMGSFLWLALEEVADMRMRACESAFAPRNHAHATAQHRGHVMQNFSTSNLGIHQAHLPLLLVQVLMGSS